MSKRFFSILLVAGLLTATVVTVATVAFGPTQAIAGKCGSTN